MRKVILVAIIAVAVLALPSFVFAKAEQQGGQEQTEQGQQVPNAAKQGTPETTVPSQVKQMKQEVPVQVQNQLQNQVKNQGETDQLQEQVQERLQTGKTDPQNSQARSETARQHMSEVAKSVEQLLAVGATGEIGKQVKEVAQEQKQAQATIQKGLDDVEARQGLKKKIMGPDYNAINDLKEEASQNQNRIQQLEKLQVEVSNNADATKIKETVQAMVSQNTALQSQINAEEAQRGLFGWLFKMFAEE